MNTQNEIYVVVAEFDGPCPVDSTTDDTLKPIVFETYVDDATKENAQKFIKSLGGRFGKCKIAKLIFESEIDY